MDILTIDDTLGGSLFCLPASSMINQGKPVFLPDFDSHFRIYPGFAARIGRMGKNVALKFASRYFEEVAPAFSVRGIDTLTKLRSNGWPLEEALSFDGSLVTGTFRIPEGLRGYETSGIVAQYDQRKMEEAVTAASAFRTLRTGDLVVWIPESDGFLVRPGLDLKATWLAPEEGEAARFRVK